MIVELPKYVLRYAGHVQRIAVYNARLINLDPLLGHAWPTTSARFFLTLHITHSDFAAHIQS